MEPLLVFPDPVPPELAQSLDLAGYPWKAVGNERSAIQYVPDDGWAGGVIVAAVDPDGAFSLCRAVRKRDLPLEPMLLLVSGAQLGDLELREDLFDNSASTRSSHWSWRPGSSTCSGGLAAAPAPSWWSTARWCSTWRPTRPT